MTSVITSDSVQAGRDNETASPFGQWRILQFDHLDAIHVALIVDVLQLRDDLVTSSAVLLI